MEIETRLVRLVVGEKSAKNHFPFNDKESSDGYLDIDATLSISELMANKAGSTESTTLLVAKSLHKISGFRGDSNNRKDDDTILFEYSLEYAGYFDTNKDLIEHFRNNKEFKPVLSDYLMKQIYPLSRNTIIKDLGDMGYGINNLEWQLEQPV